MHRNSTKCLEKPVQNHRPDDYSVNRVIKAYTEQHVDILGLYEEQFKRWKGLSLKTTQRAKIEWQLAKDDTELGLEAPIHLLGNYKSDPRIRLRSTFLIDFFVPQLPGSQFLLNST